MKIVIASTTALMALVMAGLAFAQPAPAFGHLSEFLDRLPKADANRDGSVTRAEWSAFRSSQFDRLDRNGDHYVSMEDIPGMMRGGAKGQLLQQTIAADDRDGDGRLSRDEFTSGPMPLFDEVDTNHNGVIEPQEIALARARAGK